MRPHAVQVAWFDKLLADQKSTTRLVKEAAEKKGLEYKKKQQSHRDTIWRLRKRLREKETEAAEEVEARLVAKGKITESDLLKENAEREAADLRVEIDGLEARVIDCYRAGDLDPTLLMVKEKSEAIGFKKGIEANFAKAITMVDKLYPKIASTLSSSVAELEDLEEEGEEDEDKEEEGEEDEDKEEEEMAAAPLAGDQGAGTSGAQS